MKRLFASWALLSLVVWGGIFPAQALTRQEREERVLARALVAGDSAAVETWLALHKQSAQEPLSLSSQLNLHPISIVVTRTAPKYQEEILDLLLRLGAHFNYQEVDLGMKTPLHLVMALDSEPQVSALVRFILSHEGWPSLGQPDQSGQTPVELAKLRYPDLAKALENFHAVQLSPMSLGYQATAWAKGEKNLKSYLREQELFEALDDQDLNRLKKLLEQGVDPTAHSLEMHWQTPLHILLTWPAGQIKQNFLKMLMAYEVCREAEDWQGNRPMHLAAETGQTGALSILQAHDAALEARNHLGQTPLMLAALAGEKEALLWLINAGANPQRLDNTGKTPLQAVSERLKAADMELELRGKLLVIQKLLTEKAQ
ncbi:hypothetical protein COW36_04255 [bacterium (Candidatus Blackallbacteria) CG17_big_fil_post_rev_8_21_14_2_50_48_46]|uniref:Uncharacterized protein n=1 Tax=bacterium (Candidatus Blackallbacteria) CG17_big_fil_post_rev_8_21_14_2_50_48_46 TaxID=2014261 RepID=A0A2M7G8Y9_9BACT|nr:MAG: hypothetical protein COW64_04690 [bacterium (Candidatus Blackallbacteria) CG18_big_fil_WC_8_21_14_2_50_49_26]PIW18511.1 MAG: hypothetical protein COW36_04255 [bacterium (Candidatus Blackallbacteria) CG17_big_fil_post_rev_8_21_14_2_50_48_46]PIW46504.1 MAG: hypothetical protein COW20_16425 [bacterium (Candidatus Blackallbacteria) CG13_big_fil_rev_8_21_14_2_50_49_14]